jgi:short-subunit dehydrogenase
MPGGVDTGISVNSGVEMPEGANPEEMSSKIPITSAEEAARIILDGAESDRLHIYVGRQATLMSLANRIAPRTATHLISKQMGALLPS